MVRKRSMRLTNADQEGGSRKKGYELEIGKGTTDMTPTSHHQKPPSNDSRNIQPTPSTTACTRKLVPPSSSRQSARKASLDDLEEATSVSAAVTAPVIAKQTRFNVSQLYSMPGKCTQPYKDLNGMREHVSSQVDIPNIAEMARKVTKHSNSGLIYFEEVIEISDIYSGMMRAYVKSTIITCDPYIHLAPNPQPSDLPPQTRNFDLDGLVGCTRDELAMGRDSLVTNSSKATARTKNSRI